MSQVHPDVTPDNSDAITSIHNPLKLDSCVSPNSGSDSECAIQRRRGSEARWCSDDLADAKTVVMFVSPDYFYSENETYAWVDVIRIGDLDAEGVTQSYTHNCWTTVLHHSCCPRPTSIWV